MDLKLNEENRAPDDEDENLPLGEGISRRLQRIAQSNREEQSRSARSREAPPPAHPERDREMRQRDIQAWAASARDRNPHARNVVGRSYTPARHQTFDDHEQGAAGGGVPANQENPVHQQPVKYNTFHNVPSDENMYSLASGGAVMKPSSSFKPLKKEPRNLSAVEVARKLPQLKTYGGMTQVSECKYDQCKTQGGDSSLGYCLTHFTELYNRNEIEIPTHDDVKRYVMKRDNKHAPPQQQPAAIVRPKHLNVTEGGQRRQTHVEIRSRRSDSAFLRQNMIRNRDVPCRNHTCNKRAFHSKEGFCAECYDNELRRRYSAMEPPLPVYETRDHQRNFSHPRAPHGTQYVPVLAPGLKESPEERATPEREHDDSLMTSMQPEDKHLVGFRYRYADEGADRQPRTWHGFNLGAEDQLSLSPVSHYDEPNWRNPFGRISPTAALSFDESIAGLTRDTEKIDMSGDDSDNVQIRFPSKPSDKR